MKGGAIGVFLLVESRNLNPLILWYEYYLKWGEIFHICVPIGKFMQLLAPLYSNSKGILFSTKVISYHKFKCRFNPKEM